MSIKKTVVATGVGAAVLLGGGAAALAAGSSSAPSSTTATTHGTAKSAGAKTGRKATAKDLRGLLRRSDSVTWVTGGAKKPAVTHDAIRGQVVAVSANSIRVESKGKTFQTYVIDGKTKVHVKADGEGKAGTIGQVKTGDRVTVVGTGTTTLTARRVMDAGVMKAKTPKAKTSATK